MGARYNAVPSFKVRLPRNDAVTLVDLYIFPPDTIWKDDRRLGRRLEFEYKVNRNKNEVLHIPCGKQSGLQIWTQGAWMSVCYECCVF